MFFMHLFAPSSRWVEGPVGSILVLGFGLVCGRHIWDGSGAEGTSVTDFSVVYCESYTTAAGPQTFLAGNNVALVVCSRLVSVCRGTFLLVLWRQLYFSERFLLTSCLSLSRNVFAGFWVIVGSIDMQFLVASMG